MNNVIEGTAENISDQPEQVVQESFGAGTALRDALQKSVNFQQYMIQVLQMPDDVYPVIEGKEISEELKEGFLMGMHHAFAMYDTLGEIEEVEEPTT